MNPPFIELIKCPHCGGRGSNFSIACGPRKCTPNYLRCSTCQGSGSITPERQEKIKAGEAMRKDRIKRNQTQREEAKRLGVDVVVYSRMERGLHD